MSLPDDLNDTVAEIIRTEGVKVLTLKALRHRVEAKYNMSFESHVGAIERAAKFAMEIPEIQRELAKSNAEANSAIGGKGKKRQAAKKESPKPAKMKKPDNYPKAALSPYILFVNDNRDKIKAKNPEFKNTDILRALGEAWNNAPESEKATYKTLSEKDKKRFETEMEKYKAAGGTEIGRGGKPAKAAKEGPKRAKNAFMYFSAEFRSKNTGSIIEVSRAAGAAWEKLSAAERKPYEDLAKADKERYQKELEESKALPIRLFSSTLQQPSPPLSHFSPFGGGTMTKQREKEVKDAEENNNKEEYHYQISINASPFQKFHVAALLLMEVWGTVNGPFAGGQNSAHLSTHRNTLKGGNRVSATKARMDRDEDVADCTPSSRPKEDVGIPDSQAESPEEAGGTQDVDCRDGAEGTPEAKEEGEGVDDEADYDYEVEENDEEEGEEEEVDNEEEADDFDGAEEEVGNEEEADDFDGAEEEVDNEEEADDFDGAEEEVDNEEEEEMNEENGENSEAKPKEQKKKKLSEALIIGNKRYNRSALVHNAGLEAADKKLRGNPKAVFECCTVRRPHNLLQCKGLHLAGRAMLLSGNAYVRLNMMEENKGKIELLSNPGKALNKSLCFISTGEQSEHNVEECTGIHLRPKIVFVGVPTLRTAYYEEELLENLGLKTLREEKAEDQCGSWCRTSRSHVVPTCRYVHYARGKQIYTEKAKIPSIPLAAIPDMTPKRPAMAVEVEGGEAMAVEVVGGGAMAVEAVGGGDVVPGQEVHPFRSADPRGPTTAAASPAAARSGARGNAARELLDSRRAEGSGINRQHQESKEEGTGSHLLPLLLLCMGLLAFVFFFFQIKKVVVHKEKKKKEDEASSSDKNLINFQSHHTLVNEAFALLPRDSFISPPHQQERKKQQQKSHNCWRDGRKMFHRSFPEISAQESFCAVLSLSHHNPSQKKTPGINRDEGSKVWKTWTSLDLSFLKAL
eukprot:gene828-466_t